MREIKRDSKGHFVKGHAKIGGFTVGSVHTQESIALLSKSMQGNQNRWKGKEAGYVAKHMWIVKNYGNASRCENMECVYPRKINNGRELLEKPRRYEWANVSGEYSREREDYKQLCPSCHRKWDLGKIEL